MTNTIEVEVPHEIMDYQSKVMFGLTLRQFLASLAVLVLVVPTYIAMILWIDINNQIANMMIMLISAPILAYGFIQKDGFTFDQIMKRKQAYRNSYKKRNYQVLAVKKEKFKYQKSKEMELKDYPIQKKKGKQIKQRNLARRSIRKAKRAERKIIKTKG